MWEDPIKWGGGGVAKNFAAYEGHSHPVCSHDTGHVIAPTLYISYQIGEILWSKVKRSLGKWRKERETVSPKEYMDTT